MSGIADKVLQDQLGHCAAEPKGLMDEPVKGLKERRVKFCFWVLNFFSMFIYFWDRERQSMNGGGAERSEERRVGKECASMCRSRWSPYH